MPGEANWRPSRSRRRCPGSAPARWSPPKAAAWPRRWHCAGGEIVTLPVASKSPFTILANIGRLANLIEERGVDLVHARSRAPAWSAFLAARRTGKPFVTTYHGAYGEVGPFKAAYNSVMAKGDRVIANSRYTASVIEARAPRVQRPHPRHLSRRRPQRLRSRRRRCQRGREPQSCNGASRLAPRSCCMRRGSPASRGSAT